MEYEQLKRRLEDAAESINELSLEDANRFAAMFGYITIRELRPILVERNIPSIKSTNELFALEFDEANALDAFKEGLDEKDLISLRSASNIFYGTKGSYDDGIYESPIAIIEFVLEEADGETTDKLERYLLALESEILEFRE